MAEKNIVIVSSLKYAYGFNIARSDLKKKIVIKPGINVIPVADYKLLSEEPMFKKKYSEAEFSAKPEEKVKED